MRIAWDSVAIPWSDGGGGKESRGFSRRLPIATKHGFPLGVAFVASRATGTGRAWRAGADRSPGFEDGEWNAQGGVPASAGFLSLERAARQRLARPCRNPGRARVSLRVACEPTRWMEMDFTTRPGER